MDGCIGFKESLVLSLKDSWTEADLRQLLIEKDRGEEVRYHSRDCTDKARDKGEKVSSVCDVWFHNISSENDHKANKQFSKEESGKLEDRAENDWSEEESEDPGCDKVFDGETKSDEQSQSCEEIQLQTSKHQAARFAVNVDI